jgi:hypothetical protein
VFGIYCTLTLTRITVWCALHVGASGARPIMGVQPDAPTRETIVPALFCEIFKKETISDPVAAKNSSPKEPPIAEGFCEEL